MDFSSKRPLSGRTLLIGAKSAVSDPNGEFVFTDVDPVYDLTIAETDRSAVSIYRGLSRRDPVLLHKHSPLGDGAPYSARIQGVLMTRPSSPLTAIDLASVQFISPLADDHILLGGEVPPFGPDYELSLSFGVRPSVAGKLLARGVFSQQANMPPERWFAQLDLAISDGETKLQDITLTHVGVGTLSGVISAPSGVSPSARQEYYRLPISNAVIAINNFADSASAFSDTIDDLRDGEKVLCAAAASTSGGALFSERCGLDLGQSGVSLELQSAPTLTAPSAATAVPAGAQFAWTTFENGVHLLELETQLPNALAPNIYVYTSGTTVLWPDLSGIGVSFPKSVVYDCSVAGLGPFSSLDDATSPAGLGALVSIEARQSYASTVEFTTAP